MCYGHILFRAALGSVMKLDHGREEEAKGRNVRLLFLLGFDLP